MGRLLFSDLIYRVNRAKGSAQGIVIDTDEIEFNKFLAERVEMFLTEGNFNYAVEAYAKVSLPTIVLRTAFTPPLRTIDRIEYRLEGGDTRIQITDTSLNPSAESIEQAMVGKDQTSVAGSPVTFIRPDVSTIRLIPDPLPNTELWAWGLRDYAFDPTVLTADMQVTKEFEDGLVSYCLYKLFEGVPGETAQFLYASHQPIAMEAIFRAKSNNETARRLSRGVRFKNKGKRVVTLR